MGADNRNTEVSLRSLQDQLSRSIAAKKGWDRENIASISRRIRAEDLDSQRFRRQTEEMNVESTHNLFRGGKNQLPVSFHRTELSVILSLYGRMVAAGEWRDYSISMLSEVAIFSIFRRTAEHPLYRIEKRPKLAKKQGQYSVIGMDGHILKRGHDLKTVIRVLDKTRFRLVD